MGRRRRPAGDGRRRLLGGLRRRRVRGGARGVGTPSLFDRLDSGEITVDGENQRGRELLAQGGATGFSTYTLTLTGVDLTDPAVASAAARAAQDLSAVEHVESAVNPFVVPEGPTSPQAAALVLDGDPASGGFATVVTFDGAITAEQEDAATAQVDAVLDRLAEDTGASGRSAAACAPSSTGSSSRSRPTASAARGSRCR